jgi:hypothetical protein
MMEAESFFFENLVPSYKRQDITQYKIENFIGVALRTFNLIASQFRSP